MNEWHRAASEATVTGLNPTGNAEGIWAYASPSHLWECNSVSGMRHGIRIDGVSNTPGMFTTNEMQDNDSGLLIMSGGRIGSQFQTGNRWIGTFNSALGAARYEGEEADVNASTFWANNSSNTFWPPSIESQGFAWFIPESSVFPIACGITVPCTGCEFLFFDNVTDSTDVLVATNGQLTNEAIKWQSERYLYGKLKRHGALAPSGSVFETFFNNQVTLTVGKFSGIDDAIGSFYTIDSLPKSALEQNLASMETKLDSISMLDSLLMTATGYDSLSIQSSRSLLHQEFEALAQNNLSILSPINGQRTTSAVQTINSNSAISVTQVYEQNEQSVNTVFLAALAQGASTINAQDLALLESIAGQCPLEGGNAVFKARSVLAMFGDPAMYADDDLCQPLEQRQGHNQGVLVTSEPVFTLFPNPAKDEVMLKWTERDGVGSQLQLRMYDTMGNLISMNELSTASGNFMLSTSLLVPGMYTVKISSNGKQVQVEKLVVIK